MMSAREAENARTQAEHLEACRLSNLEHLAEMERKRIENMQYVDTKFVEFWSTKKRNAQNLRDKAQQ